MESGWLRETDLVHSEAVTVRWVEWLIKTRSSLCLDMRRRWGIFLQRQARRTDQTRRKANRHLQLQRHTTLQRECQSHIVSLEQLLPLEPSFRIPPLPDRPPRPSV